MLRVLTEGTEIQKAQDELKSVLLQGATGGVATQLGFQGGSQPATVYWHDHLGFWFALERELSRFWNAFGLGRRDKGTSGLSIAVEINFPYDGINRSVAGAFAEGGDGRLYVVHRGVIGGGTKGVGKKSFLEHYKGRAALEKVRDGKQDTEVIVITALADPMALKHVQAFVLAVDSFKRGHSGTAKRQPGFQGRAFRPEFEGVKVLSQVEQVEANYHHGTVVNTLEHRLRTMGWRTGSDLRDLFLYDEEGEELVVFEVKSRGDRYSIYTAIGQLILLNPVAKDVTKVAVLPKDLPEDVVNDLIARNILVVTYAWKGKDLHFDHLSDVLPSTREGNVG